VTTLKIVERIEAPPAGGGPRHRRELVTATLLTALVALLLVLLGPAPGDAPAHLYRTLLVRDGAFLWDNLWYAGNYPLASYSLLYYLPAAAVGNLPLVFAAAVASTALFCSIAYREWGEHALWPCRAFGVLAAAPIFTGLYSYSLGFTAMLAAIRAIQLGRLWLALPLAALTFGFSPLAFVFLCLILAAVVIAQRRVTRRALLVGAAVAATAAFGLAVMLVFPTGGVYSFHPVDFGCVLATCTAGALLAWRVPRARFIFVFFVLWGLVSIFCYLVPTPVGDNVTRLSAFVFPLVLVTAALARFRPRLLVIVALGGALAYNIVPYVILIPYRLDPRPATERFWAPAVTYLAERSGPSYRVEVVPTAAHWEAYWFPKASLPLARGWYRQLDMADYPVLFEHALTAAAYEQWLRATGVRYVLLPATKLDPKGGPAEARIVRSGLTSLRAVSTTSAGTVYELPQATRIITGPAPAELTALEHAAVEGWVAAPGAYRLRVRYSPYWEVRPAGACVRAAADGMMDIALPSAGAFSVRFPDDVGDVLSRLTGSRSASGHCPA
jgi:hypothetical protein